MKIFTQRDFPK